MREAIEKVIDELDKESAEHGLKYTDKRNDDRRYHLGFESGLDRAIDMLKEVLREHEPDPKGEQHPS